MWLERLERSAADIIDLNDAKKHLREIDDEFQLDIERAIAAAGAYLDVDDDGFGGLGFPLLSQKWSSKASRFQPTVLRLPFGRITEVNEIQYFDQEGVSRAIPSSDYTLTKRGRAFVIEARTGFSWPSVSERPDAVSVVFTAGYRDVGQVPDDIKAAARLLIGHFFGNRSATEGEKVPQEIELGVERLICRYRSFAM